MSKSFMGDILHLQIQALSAAQLCLGEPTSLSKFFLLTLSQGKSSFLKQGTAFI